MNFSDLRKSFLNDYYSIVNDMVLVFDTSTYTDSELQMISSEARKHVDCGFLFQTSGTTSDKKFVLHSFESVKTSGESVNKWIDVNQSDKFLAPISIHHMGGFSLLFRAFIAGIDKPFVQRSWSLREFKDVVLSEKITVTSMVPSQVYEIVQSGIQSPHTLKAVFVGGSSIDNSIYIKARELGWPILKTFGSSEGCSQIFTQKFECTPDTLTAKPLLKLCTDNDLALYALPHWEVKTNRDDHLMVKGLSLFRGYIVVKDRKAVFDRVKLDEDGFYVTEDRMKIIGRKIDYFQGRINDYVKINSTLVQLSALRANFYQFCLDQKLNAERTVIAVKSDIKSGLYLSVISEDMDASLFSAIQAWNAHSISAERIRGIYYKKIPRTELGKIKYKDL